MKADRRGFTLIELLVVIAVIAILMSILVPSLQHAREMGKRAVCLTNVKNLMTAWNMYADDQADRVPSGVPGSELGWVGHADPASMSELEQEEAVRKGVLWKYLGRTIEAYRCPSGKPGEVRSYSMPDAFSWEPSGPSGVIAFAGADPQWAVTRRSHMEWPAERMVFLDEGFTTPSTWSIFYSQPRWWDPVPIRHGDGTVLAFADGHGEHWKWQDARTIEFGMKADALEDPDEASYWRETQIGNEDIYDLVRAVWGRVGFTR